MGSARFGPLQIAEGDGGFPRHISCSLDIPESPSATCCGPNLALPSTSPLLSQINECYAFTLDVSRLSSGTQSSIRNAAPNDDTTKIV